MSDFKKNNRKDWIKALGSVLPAVIPESARWTSLEDIIRVISAVAKPNLNHTLFPTGGGLDLTGIRASDEPGCVELMVDKVAYIVRPVALTFHFVRDYPAESYFRLETEGLAPSGVYPGLTGDYEEVVRLGPNQYHDRSAWDEQNLGESDEGIIPLPKGSRLVLRYFRGAFLIVAKGSLYNSISATYDGRHNKMSDPQFRDYMANLIEQNEKWIADIDQPEAA